MKATLHVTAEVVAGTERGGEDLFLKLYAQVDGEELPTEFDVELSEVSGDGFSADADYGEDDPDLDEGDPGYGELQSVKYTSDHYEFSTQVVVSEVLEKYKGKLLDPKNWFYCHQFGTAPKLRFTHREYVGGNAE